MLLLWPRLVLIILIVLSPLTKDQEPFDSALREITAGQRFSFARWHLTHFANLLRPVTMPLAAVEDPSAYVETYFDLMADVRSLERTQGGVPPEWEDQLRVMRPAVERIIAEQVATAFGQQGIHNPLDRFVRIPVLFPPVWFVLDPPPHLLVVSPRDKIVSFRQVMLVSEMNVATMIEIETQIEALGYSALVAPLGGFGATYPAVVNPNSSLPATLEIVAEEWLHQYLAFTPLGFAYVMHLLNVRPDTQVAQLNESLATIVHEEIGQWAGAAYYDMMPSVPPAPLPALPSEEEPVFDFRAFMRETRLETEALLAQGEIDAAEEYMESRRQIAVSEGYRLRKLNQAYFALHGTYADAPGAITPVGSELRALREQSSSLGAFLNAVAGLTTRAELLDLLDEQGLQIALNEPLVTEP